MRRVTQVVLAATPLLLAGTLSAAPAFAAGGAGTRTSVIYSSLAGTPLPANLPSVGAEAYAFNELGNEVTFSAGSPRHLSNVVVTMSSWACVSGNWYSDNCSTPAGATFTEPITLNIYKASTDGVHPGSLITSMTRTFTIPYRPSASPICDSLGFTGEWYQQKTKTCYHGLAANISFDFSAINVTLPSEIVYGIAYNSEHYGYSPYGPAACDNAASNNNADCPYDSLNIALSSDDPGQPDNNVTVGSDPNLATIWQNSPFGSQYCDGGAAGTGVFRLDSPTSACWSQGTPGTVPAYVPAVQFKAGGGTS